MSSSIQPTAGPSKPRRKPVAENWDEDFDFDMKIESGPSTTQRNKGSSRALSGRLDDAVGSLAAAEPVSPPGGGHAPYSSARSAKGEGGDSDDMGEMEDWDAEFCEGAGDSRSIVGQGERLDSHGEAEAMRAAGGGGGMIGRRVSRGPAPLKLRPTTPPGPSAAHVVSATSTSTAPIVSSSKRYSSSSPDRHAPSHWTSIPPPSVPSYSQPYLSHSRATNDSTSSLGSAWSVSDQTPSRAYNSAKSQGALPSPSPKPTRTLRHMKSGEMMPPPPLNSVRGVVGAPAAKDRGSGMGCGPSPVATEGSGLLRRKSEKRKSVGKSVGIEEEQAASPASGKSKPGFWRRLSSQQAYEPDHEAEARRNRSSSVGSPTKQRFDDTPPLPPLPPNIRSASNASTASHQSQYSQHSGSSSVSVARSYTGTGLASILRRSSSNLANKVKGRGGSSEVPPTPSMQNARIPSGSSAMSSHSLHSVQSRASRTSSQQSFSRGYHLPSPSSQSPYGDIGQATGRPQMHQSQSFSATPLDSDRSAQSATEDTQTTPKKRRPLSVVPPRSSGWKGEAWTGFPPRSPRSPQKTVRSPRTGVFSRSPVKARPALGVSSGQPRTPTTPRAPATAGVDDEKGTSTFKRLQSLGKKHGRRLSGGWKFGTGGSNSSEEREKDRGEKKVVSRLETVEGSPSKSLRGEEEGSSSQGGDMSGVGESRRAVQGSADSGAAQTEGGKVTYSSPALKFSASPRLISDKFDQHVEYLHATGTQRLKVKDDKERRRQSWNDFVIPRNVLEKQKELKEGIRGVRKFASGIEALKTLQSTHAAVEARISSADTDTRSTFNALEDEFDQWWEMATVLIEVGNTGQGMSGSAASVSPVLSSPTASKRNRRITLASEEAKAASNVMRRAKTDFAPLSPGLQLTSPRLPEKPETRKASLPDPADVTFGFPASTSGGPPRASPDLWHGSTGRHELSKRQLEVLRTMLQTPVSEAGSSGSGAARPGATRGMSGSSTVSSTMSGLSGTRQTHGRASRQSMTQEGLSQSASPLTHVMAIRQKGPESFPSPGESTYITPSDSMPSPLTASLLANAQTGREDRLTSDQLRQASKMRKGSKVGLAGLKEFLKGLKGKESRTDLSAWPQSATGSAQMPSKNRPTQQVGRRASRMSMSRAKGPAMASPPNTPTPGAQWTRPTQKVPPSAIASKADVSLSRTTTGESDYGQGVSRSDAISKSASRSETGPPVSGKDRRRPGLRGIFRGGSGNWGDLVNTGKTPITPDNTGALSAQLERIQISSGKRSSSQGVRPGVHPNPRQSSDPVRRDSRIVSDAPSHRSEPADMMLSAPSTATDRQRASEYGARATSSVDLGEEGEMTVRPRKSRVLGLGWPEEVPAARAALGQGQGQDRNVSAASGFSFDSDKENEPDPVRHSSAPAAGHRGISDIPGETSGGGRISSDSGLAVQETGMIALTPENLPVLLEYLRQCEGKLGEWRKRVEALNLGVRDYP